MNRNQPSHCTQSVAEPNAIQSQGLSERDLARFFSLSAQLLCVADFDGNFVRLNPAWESTLGFSQRELLSKPYLEFVHPDDRAATMAESTRLQATGLNGAFENRYRCRDGTYRRLLWNYISMPAERLIYATAHDITERRLTEAALAKTHAESERVNHELQFHKFALDQHAIVAITDRAGLITCVNEKFCEISGYSREELIGQDHRIVNSGTHPKSFFKDLWGSIAHGRVWRGEIRNRAKDGRIYWVDTTIVPFKGESGRIIGYVAIRADITERKLAAADIERVQEKLKEQNQRLAALTVQAHGFVDDVSHEFRTPLAVIKEFCAIIADGLAGPITAEQGQYLGIIDSAVLDLNQMVEDFLDSSKLRAGCLRVFRRPTMINTLFATIRPGLQRKAASRAITVVEQIDADIPLVFADEEKVRRVIMNLATNAIKFSPEGSRIELWARSAQEGGIEVGVTDQGRGLSAVDLRQIFERFRQLPNAEAASVKGFGLGLNIARQLVWLNLGTMSVTSELGRGSTFSFTLPPNNSRKILDRFFMRLEECELAAPSVAVISVTPEDVTESADAIRLFLAATTRPTDVILDMPHATENSLLVVGPTESATGWVRRLSQERDSIAGEEAAKLKPIRIEILGTFAYPSEATDAMSCALEHLSQEPVNV